MPQKLTVKYQNRDVTGESIPFTSAGEHWVEYQLADGSSMKVKVVMMDVVRLDNEYGDNGDPVYVFTAQQVVGIFPNPELKRKEN